MEILDIVDSHGLPTGETVDREAAHADGIPHRTSHVWLVRRHEGVLQVLFQLRSETKDSFPGCYDISSAGHIPAGEDWVPSALRELQEELGVTAEADQLVLCGQRHICFERVFHGRDFRDNQYSNVYYMWCDKPEADFTLQAEEVSAVKWFDFEDALKCVSDCTIPNCISAEELNMVRRKILLG